MKQPFRRLACFVLTLSVAITSSAQLRSPGVEEYRSAHAIAWHTGFGWESAQFAISGPCGDIAWTVSAGTPLRLAVEDLEVWGLLGGTAWDGQYNYEISFAPIIDPAKRAELDRLRADADGAGPVSVVVPELPVASGSFRVSGGTIVGAASGGAETEAVAKDVLHYDDVIVTGSLCVGFDCANGESFGYDTVKLKENNLRLFFEDTSAGSFPSGDWRLRVNDTTSGGASYFAVEDGTNGRTPFRIETGAPTHSLYVEDYGRVGLGTSIPYVELHIVDCMVQVIEPGKIANWVAEPHKGINDNPFDYQYVKFH